MKTTELIELLKSVEFGASGRPREVSLNIDGLFVFEPVVFIESTGDGCAGAELCLGVRKGE